MNKKQRMKNRQTYAALMNKLPRRFFECMNCHELTDHGHYFPPCMGDDGFFICKEKEIEYDDK